MARHNHFLFEAHAVLSAGPCSVSGSVVKAHAELNVGRMTLKGSVQSKWGGGRTVFDVLLGRAPSPRVPCSTLPGCSRTWTLSCLSKLLSTSFSRATT